MGKSCPDRKESVARAGSYRDAGADCLSVPGMTDAETIGRLVKGGPRPGQRGHGPCRQSVEREPARGPGGEAGEYRRLARPRHVRAHPAGGRGDPRFTAPSPMRKSRCRMPSSAGSSPAGSARLRRDQSLATRVRVTEGVVPRCRRQGRAAGGHPLVGRMAPCEQTRFATS